MYPPALVCQIMGTVLSEVVGLQWSGLLAVELLGCSGVDCLQWSFWVAVELLGCSGVDCSTGPQYTWKLPSDPSPAVYGTLYMKHCHKSRCF